MSNIIEINNFAAPELEIFARLSEVQLLRYYEPSNGLFIAESPKVIDRALNAGYEPVSFLIERKHIDRQAHDILARCQNIPVYTANLDVLTQLTGFQMTRGMLCAMKRRNLPSITEICSHARRIAVLENIVNPTNVGAIFRSAAALNMDAVLLTPACSDPLYRRSARVSMGTVFQIPWTYFKKESIQIKSYMQTETTDTGTNAPSVSYIKQLREQGFKTVAMALNEHALNIDDPRLMAEEKLAIVLGTEGEGLADSTIADCDYTVCIPMSHGVDSLNVAAASAVAFWQLGKQ